MLTPDPEQAIGYSASFVPIPSKRAVPSCGHGAVCAGFSDIGTRDSRLARVDKQIQN